MSSDTTLPYDQDHSFDKFVSYSDKNIKNIQKTRAINIINSSIKNKKIQEKKLKIINMVYDSLNNNSELSTFNISSYEADEMQLLENNQIVDYLYHRYRYMVYPREKIIDNYPPLLQIEPASVCNFRCVFCYQIDETFNKKKSGFMGTMTFDLFKQIIDQIEGEIGFITMASRGEPLLAKDLPKMLDYINGKFLTVKINTNASMLNEKMIHNILSSGVNTVVFSADAAEENLYSRLRVNGSLNKTLKNIELFSKIKGKQYSDTKLITRVSGVMYDRKNQDLDSMVQLWGSLVDQVSFVNYCPWENIYKAEPNNIKEPCSDLWRRMFVWFDGSMNPCDSDYKSILSLGSIENNTISELWCSEAFDSLRKKHLSKDRLSVNPCNGCTVV